MHPLKQGSRPLSLLQLEVRDAQRRLSENEGAAVELHKRALAAEQAVLVSPLYRKSIALIRSLSRRRSKQRPWRRQLRPNTKRRYDYVRFCEKYNTFSIKDFLISSSCSLNVLGERFTRVYNYTSQQLDINVYETCKDEGIKGANLEAGDRDGRRGHVRAQTFVSFWFKTKVLKLGCRWAKQKVTSEPVKWNSKPCQELDPNSSRQWKPIIAYLIISMGLLPVTALSILFSLGQWSRVFKTQVQGKYWIPLLTFFSFLL